ncbi:hypothetical protein HPP92_024502 [Vanilla planifolia]|uniref:Beta-Casp domain-containing protein n=1 Tax=Vanilla planifolia TaxID=51239 RepID=A0A835UBE0_VANPL|nr:hypothetical protein HPP92_024776 [Vanilla planifolia]KAG0456714.1 hypothetical protein HPP92_024502 [Vanilla planifolia]
MGSKITSKEVPMDIRNNKWSLRDEKQSALFDRSLLNAPGPCVLFATPGMISGGFSLEAFKQWAPSEKNLVTLPGYCVAGTIGHKLMCGKPTQINLDKDTCINVRCQIHQLSFSPHTDAKGIMDLVGFLSPKHVMLVHGEKPKMATLKGRIETELGIPCFVPENNECVQIPSSQHIKVAFQREFLRNSFNLDLSNASHGQHCVSDSVLRHEITEFGREERTAEGILVMEKNKMPKIVTQDELLHILGAEEHLVQMAYCCPVKLKNGDTGERNLSSGQLTAALLQLLVKEVKSKIACSFIRVNSDHLEIESFKARVCLKKLCPHRLKQGGCDVVSDVFFCCSWLLIDDELARKVLCIMRDVELEPNQTYLLPHQFAEPVQRRRRWHFAGPFAIAGKAVPLLLSFFSRGDSMASMVAFSDCSSSAAGRLLLSFGRRGLHAHCSPPISWTNVCRNRWRFSAVTPVALVTEASSKIIDGKSIAKKIRDEIAGEIVSIKDSTGIVPGLAVILVGSRKDSQTYVRNKKKACDAVGIASYEVNLPEDCKEEEVIKHISEFNSNPAIHGILVQLPLPRQMNEEKILNAVSIEKDVDGFHPLNIGRLAMQGRDPLFVPCTPKGCMELLHQYEIGIKGKRAVVIGRSNIVGMPVALLLQRENATVCMVHSYTKNPAEITSQADIVISAAGVANLVRGNWLKPGAVVIDVGINPIDDPEDRRGYRLVGDVCFEEARAVAAAITPVPGGVGPMTIAMLLSNTLSSAKRIHGLS